MTDDKNKIIAQKLVSYFGGEDNLVEVINCMTRVRVKVKDQEKVSFEKIEELDGIMGLVKGDQIQVVTGPGKSEKIAREMANLTAATFTEESEIDIRTRENKEKVKQGQKDSAFKSFTATIASIFVPLIPAFVGAGLIGGIASVLQNLITAGSVSGETYVSILQVLNIIKTGLYGYLNVFIGINAAKVFRGNEGLGGVIGGMIYLSAMNPDKPLKNIFLNSPLLPGQGGVIGVILAVFILVKIEKNLRKVIPDALDIILVPTISLLLTGILTMFIIMPIAGLISNGLIGVINGVIKLGGAFSGFILGAVFLPMVMLGLHQILTPIHVAMIESQGATYLLPILAMAGAGQVGAAIAVLVKCRKNKKLIEIAKGGLPVGILGIGEPLIYALTLPMGKAFITACLGGGVGGAIIGAIGNIGATAIGPSGLALIPLIYNGRAFGYILGLLGAYIGGFILTYLFGIDKKYVEGEDLTGSKEFKFK
ncbi:PTS transporter subunit EIIC [Anaerococcus porci]|uniref:Permease n=1 Tax=Anaerococcus porci TaxID=2652269 RepID=A0A6N7VDR3_9FIRM|nr:PTS transporter subunit EIIC [Anaerococcus porci]MDY3006040.1 PTS transporter subunit EIIC [Anaerococcus porci]MSS77565.1 permease [Anaerococcus porci]